MWNAMNCNPHTVAEQEQQTEVATEGRAEAQEHLAAEP